jgi:hypothetical protein
MHLIAAHPPGRSSLAACQPGRVRFLLPSADMPASLTREDDGIYRLEVRGWLKKAELDSAQQEMLQTRAGRMYRRAWLSRAARRALVC